MCGIAGIYDPLGIDLNTIINISKVLRHRGPDDEGFLLMDSDDMTTQHEVMIQYGN